MKCKTFTLCVLRNVNYEWYSYNHFRQFNLTLSDTDLWFISSGKFSNVSRKNRVPWPPQKVPLQRDRKMLIIPHSLKFESPSKKDTVYISWQRKSRFTDTLAFHGKENPDSLILLKQGSHSRAQHRLQRQYNILKYGICEITTLVK
jgi:hypothetical protein